ncbi:MAG: S9 family peptidase [Pseudomonadota bacterium]
MPSHPHDKRQGMVICNPTSAFAAQALRTLALLVATLLFTAACSIAPTHPTLKNADLPELVPVRAFTANLDFAGDYKISPDGGKLLWRGVSRLRPALFWRDLQSGDAGVQRFKKRSPNAFWAADSRHILYHADASGRENYQVVAWDTQSGNQGALTPTGDVRAFVVHVPRTASDDVYIAHNGRDRQWFDLYRYNLQTHQSTLRSENLNAVVNRMLDDGGRELLRIRIENDEFIAEVREGDAFRELLRHDRFTEWHPFDFSADNQSVLGLSNRGRDKLAFVSTRLSDGTETVLVDHPNVDIGNVYIDPDTKALLYYQTYDGHPEDVAVDDGLAQLLAPLRGDTPHSININSLSHDRSTGTVTRYDHTGSTYYLIEAGGTSLTELGQSPSRKRAEVWTEGKPFSVPARDGLMLHGYLTRPQLDAEQLPLPTVLHVHGGPWHRDYWGHADMIQMLANRGYAVLQINYRGSTGYGRAHRDAAKREFAGKMHSDLIDVLDWAIAEGVTDPARVAIMGGSYGGYATLVGLTFTPERFACGIDVVGPSDLATLIEDAPPYWAPYMPFWHSFAGDPSIPAERADLDSRSPLHRADQLQSPVLIIHGRNDPRVKVDQSDRMVEALRAAGKPVTYKTVDDEGHGFSHWKNQLAYYRDVEDFLAGCLGGRSSGFDFFSLGSWAF